jgi:uncharacterized protein YhbP (UPF0306 family)
MSEPAGEDLRGRISAFLQAHTTLNLATSGSDGAPAAAAVFYAHDAGLSLYFLSEKLTQHSVNLAGRSAAACTIQADGQDWRQIRGLQMQGSVERVQAEQLVHAAAVYSRKYTFVAALLARSGGPVTLAGPLARARFYVFRPAWIRLIDNTVRFGYKEELRLNVA